MDLIPILSTVILIATIVTLIVAITSYIVFRVKESKRSRSSESTQSHTPDGVGQSADQTVPFLPGTVGPAGQPVQQTNVRQDQNISTASRNNMAEGQLEQEYTEDDFQDDVEEEPEEELSAAQAAFMNSMRTAIGEGQGGRRTPPPTDTKMRRYKISKNNDESIGDDEDGGRSLWR